MANIEPVSLYTKEIHQLYRSLRWPKGLKCRLVERYQAITGEPFLRLEFFYENFKALDGEDQKHIAGLVSEFMTKVRKMGVPIYFKVMEGDGIAETQAGVRLVD